MAAKKHYMLGSKPCLWVQFRDPNTGALADPDTVVLKVKGPTDDTGAEKTVTRLSKGIYFYVLTVDEAGTWEWTYSGVTTTNGIVVKGDLLCEDPGV
jgi:hypothetical protein